MENELIIQRSFDIVKNNKLIRKSRHNFTMQQQKILLFLISRIKNNSKIFELEEFEINEFCEVCGIEKNQTSQIKTIKNYIEDLSNKSMWLQTDEDTEILVRWISNAEINKRSGTIKLKLDDGMKPYLLELKKNFTTYSLIWTLRMKSKYSLRLYELLKSYENLHEDIILTVEQLKDRIGSTYEEWYDVKRKSIEPAIKEINAQTDISVVYDIEKKGKSVNKIIFKIQTKGTVEQLLAKTKNNATLNAKYLAKKTIAILEDNHTGFGYDVIAEKEKRDNEKRELKQVQNDLRSLEQ